MNSALPLLSLEFNAFILYGSMQETDDGIRRLSELPFFSEVSFHCAIEFATRNIRFMFQKRRGREWIRYHQKLGLLVVSKGGATRIKGNIIWTSSSFLITDHESRSQERSRVKRGAIEKQQEGEKKEECH